MGRIVSVYTDTNQCTTYEICDGMAADPLITKRFTVIRYGGSDLVNYFFNMKIIEIIFLATEY